MTPTEFQEFWEDRRTFDTGARRYRVRPLFDEPDRALHMGGYMVWLADFWRGCLVTELTADDCNERVYVVEADGFGAFANSPITGRRRYLCAGVDFLKQLLEGIENDSPDMRGLRRHRATGWRIDGGEFERNFDASMGEGAFQSMRARMMTPEAERPPVAPPPSKRPNVDKFYRRLCNADHKGW